MLYPFSFNKIIVYWHNKSEFFDENPVESLIENVIFDVLSSKVTHFHYNGKTFRAKTQCIRIVIRRVELIFFFFFKQVYFPFEQTWSRIRSKIYFRSLLIFKMQHTIEWAANKAAYYCWYFEIGKWRFNWNHCCLDEMAIENVQQSRKSIMSWFTHVVLVVCYENCHIIVKFDMLRFAATCYDISIIILPKTNQNNWMEFYKMKYLIAPKMNGKICKLTDKNQSIPNDC